ncbi:P43 5S RNA-binding protein-like [Pangasianodon hypophthalmus]|uniref:P43 5S RNA-binding protein-like n=1 Tax=Pangasianodon hypophthalmus TaxID=310915 RepID=UPI0023080881|nr:P43 5S RNA-binding protein-like [Pangasianodon hypophthalmus]
MSEQQKSVKADAVPRLQLFNCVHADCGATFTRRWRLEEHETAHTGARPHKCPAEGCARSFSRRSHLSRHALKHKGQSFRCTAASCSKVFSSRDKLRRHVRYAHADKERFFTCTFPGCVMTFRKRRLLKLHQATHGVFPGFRCSKAGCSLTFSTRVARKAHEKTHTGYRCPHSQCPVVEHTWGKLQKHAAKHPASHSCSTCKKTFGKLDALRRHKRTHAPQKPVLLCPSDGCQAYFSTTFNLQHHIRKVHLKLLRHHCSFPGCEKAFAMRESLVRHMLHHDPDAAKLKRRQKRSSKSWQKRLEGRSRGSLVEDDLRRLFTLRMRFSRRTKLEANLSGLFNERKIPRHVDPEVNLRDLFNIKPPQKVKG